MGTWLSRHTSLRWVWNDGVGKVDATLVTIQSGMPLGQEQFLTQQIGLLYCSMV